MLEIATIGGHHVLTNVALIIVIIMIVFGGWAVMQSMDS